MQKKRINWKLAGGWLAICWGITFIFHESLIPAIGWTAILVVVDLLLMIFNRFIPANHPVES